jgi:hypothetical protein
MNAHSELAKEKIEPRSGSAPTMTEQESRFTTRGNYSTLFEELSG